MIPIAGMVMVGIFQFFQESFSTFRLAYLLSISLLIISLIQMEYQYRKKIKNSQGDSEVDLL